MGVYEGEEALGAGKGRVDAYASEEIVREWVHRALVGNRRGYTYVRRCM